MTDTEAMAFWIRTGCVTDEYLRRVLGDPARSVTVPGPIPYYTEAELAHMMCPFPPEPDWE